MALERGDAPLDEFLHHHRRRLPELLQLGQPRLREQVDGRLACVWKRLARLQKLGVTELMVVKEFVQWRIAPLQRHSRPMWAFTGAEDSMRLQEQALPSKTLNKVLELLTGNYKPADLPGNGCLLYQCSNKVADTSPTYLLFQTLLPLFWTLTCMI